MPTFVHFLVAILSEATDTSALKLSDEFNKSIPSVVVVVGFGLALWLISKSLREIAIGTVYAAWSELGTVGIVLIVAEVIMLNAFGGAH